MILEIIKWLVIWIGAVAFVLMFFQVVDDDE